MTPAATPPHDDQRWDDPELVCAALGLPAPDERLRSDWPWSQATWGSDPAFLASAGIGPVCDLLAFGADLRAAVLGACAVYARHPALHRLAWHLHQVLASTPFGQPVALAWPVLPERLGANAAFAHLHVLLSRVPALLAFHRGRGIDERVSLDTLDDVQVWIEDHRRTHGVIGFSNPGWLTNHLTGRIYRLGRLQFEPTPFRYDVHVYRHRRDRRVIALAGDHGRFRTDGQHADADHATAASDGFTSRFGDDGRTIVGHPIGPLGATGREAITLASDEWERVLTRGDPVLGVHIPAMGPMDHIQCGESMRRAGPFFARHLPECAPTAFACSSWLLDATLGRLLPPEANIVRFQREFHLLPHPRACDRQSLERVFGGPIPDLDAAPRTSSLQRAIVAHLRAGGRLREAGGFLLMDDLDWGRCTYQR